MNIEELIYKIKEDFPILKLLINDIKYKVKIKNKYYNREDRIIIFGEKEKFELLNGDKTTEIFMDITFKIIPVKFLPYKLIVIAGISKDNNIPNILVFIMLKYLDNISYDQIFNYLHENFNFKPKIIQKKN